MLEAMRDVSAHMSDMCCRLRAEACVGRRDLRVVREDVSRMCGGMHEAQRALLPRVRQKVPRVR